ncbi:hypothetical protein NRB_45620 [Novosphingobium sp. 11B]|uniref:Uncharacterized protein n=1 Tax=Novosphingobium resinovorum TaxID=158500 RepID=A0A031IZW1_9SPHN|nr:hypothetical protein BES08_20330 [Novosphingobium resinovorum]EZP66567.1 hypothetical protein BV97_05753 [Novosphingobium resinovorum]
MVVHKRPDRTLGHGNDTFWAWCDRQELRLPRCTGCHTLAWPIEAACTTCGGEGFAWERLSGRGAIASWCTFERDYYQGQFPMPWDCILVELEEGPLFIANPAGMTGQGMRLGLPVRLAFLGCEDEAGPFNLPVFETDERADRPARSHPTEELIP